MAQQEVIFAGFGGQGILSMGKFLAYGGMERDFNVSWCPSYGPEMRGGTANCSVIISDDIIGSPVITLPDSLIVMNRPSFDKFEHTLKPGGLMIMDSDLIANRPQDIMGSRSGAVLSPANRFKDHRQHDSPGPWWQNRSYRWMSS